MATQLRPNHLDEIEQFTRINQLQADINAKNTEINRKRQEMHLAPWQLALSGITAGGALFAAGAAFTKFFVPDQRQRWRPAAALPFRSVAVFLCFALQKRRPPSACARLLTIPTPRGLSATPTTARCQARTA
jgi:hypothetical protein